MIAYPGTSSPSDACGRKGLLSPAFIELNAGREEPRDLAGTSEGGPGGCALSGMILRPLQMLEPLLEQSTHGLVQPCVAQQFPRSRLKGIIAQ